eukprot:TRINITY_DN2957_c0_g1_i2.p1 TRINITY_DN2957_c0_g1~~TRINITY_DN2957_c0_g1_i2.p1  ORF type:complete len:631 (-),score=121.52 TRINITY_DN2957_c0_g1_i2:206-2098(-)
MADNHRGDGAVLIPSHTRDVGSQRNSPASSLQSTYDESNWMMEQDINPDDERDVEDRIDYDSLSEMEHTGGEGNRFTKNADGSGSTSLMGMGDVTLIGDYADAQYIADVAGGNVHGDFGGPGGGGGNGAAGGQYGVGGGGTQVPRATRAKLIVCILIVFLSNTGFSIVIPALYGFLDHLGVSSKFQLGVTVAVFSLGQTIGAPAFGWMCDKRNVRDVFVLSLLLTVVGDFLYAFSNNWPTVLVARFITGIGSGNQAIAQAFIATSTTAEDRTVRMGQLALASVASFAVGPAIGAGLSLVSIPIFSYVVFDQYRAPGFYSAFMGLINLVLVFATYSASDVTVSPDEERRRKRRRRRRRRKKNGSVVSLGHHGDDSNGGDDDTKSLLSNVSAQSSGRLRRRDRRSSSGRLASLRPIIIPLFGLIIIYFLVFNGGSVYETTTVPYTTDVYGWGITRNELLWALCGLLSVVAFVSLAVLVRYFSDIVVLSFFLVLFTSGFWMMARFDAAPQQWRFIAGTALVAFSFPGCMAEIIAIYSKLLGSAPQGIALGMLTGAGAFARLIGPLWSGYAYDYFAGVDKFHVPYIFTISAVGTAVGLIVLLVCWCPIRNGIANAQRKMREGGSARSGGSSDGM